MTLTALVMTAALAVTSAGTLIEALSHGGGGAPEADAIGQVLRIGALAAVLGAALLLPSVLRRRAPAGAPALPEGSRAYAPAAASSREK
jgi:hypothetical protein